MPSSSAVTTSNRWSQYTEDAAGWPGVEPTGRRRVPRLPSPAAWPGPRQPSGGAGPARTRRQVVSGPSTAIRLMARNAIRTASAPGKRHVSRHRLRDLRLPHDSPPYWTCGRTAASRNALQSVRVGLGLVTSSGIQRATAGAPRQEHLALALLPLLLWLSRRSRSRRRRSRDRSLDALLRDRSRLDPAVLVSVLVFGRMPLLYARSCCCWRSSRCCVLPARSGAGTLAVRGCRALCSTAGFLLTIPLPPLVPAVRDLSASC
jgi:hypothetical protein